MLKTTTLFVFAACLLCASISHARRGVYLSPTAQMRAKIVELRKLTRSTVKKAKQLANLKRLSVFSKTRAKKYQSARKRLDNTMKLTEKRDSDVLADSLYYSTQLFTPTVTPQQLQAFQTQRKALEATFRAAVARL
ncbi:MAG: hypothetical protein JRH20_08835 [Deltaproteobacteria bacterium]|nr:hypothetical protein [Deltaproteobacteria bacterium]